MTKPRETGEVDNQILNEERRRRNTSRKKTQPKSPFDVAIVIVNAFRGEKEEKKSTSRKRKNMAMANWQ